MSSPLRSRFKEAVVREVLDAAEAILCEQRILATGGKASMAEIAARAGVSVGSIYNYFKDKDEVVRTLIATRCDQYVATIEQALTASAAEPFPEQLAAVVASVLGFYDAHRNFGRFVFESDQPGGGLASQRTPWIRAVEAIRPLVERGVTGGHLSPGNVSLYAPSLVGIMYSVMMERLADDTKSFASDAPDVIAMFLRGAGAPG